MVGSGAYSQRVRQPDSAVPMDDPLRFVQLAVLYRAVLDVRNSLPFHGWQSFVWLTSPEGHLFADECGIEPREYTELLVDLLSSAGRCWDTRLWFLG